MSVAAKTRRTRVFVDEIDGAVARLVLGARAFTVPRALLPRAAREGAWVEVSVAIAPAAGSTTERRRRRLARDDDGGDVKL
jgi:hypothetical protein